MNDAGSQLSFIIEISGSQFSTWQGKVTCVGQGRRQDFCSEVELLRMIEEALKAGNQAGQPAAK